MTPKVTTGNCNNTTVYINENIAEGQYILSKRISLVNNNAGTTTINLYKRVVKTLYRIIPKDTSLGTGEALEITDTIYLKPQMGFVLTTNNTIDYDFNMELIDA